MNGNGRRLRGRLGLFVVLALVLRPSWLAKAVMAASAVLLVLLTVQFAQWYWVS